MVLRRGQPVSRRPDWRRLFHTSLQAASLAGISRDFCVVLNALDLSERLLHPSSPCQNPSKPPKQHCPASTHGMG